MLCRRHPRLVAHYVVSPRRITGDSIRRVVPDRETAVFLVSGPEPFVQSIEGALSRMGVPDARVKRDYFPGYGWA